MSMPSPIAAKRSMFVTVVAWVFIGLSAFAALMLLLYSVMLPRIFYRCCIGNGVAQLFQPAFLQPLDGLSITRLHFPTACSRLRYAI